MEGKGKIIVVRGLIPVFYNSYICGRNNTNSTFGLRYDRSTLVYIFHIIQIKYL